MTYKAVFLTFLLLIVSANCIFSQSNDTIIKCAKDIESPNAEIRQQAAMILGKYEQIESTELLLKHLKDESPLVRRAVLVSLQDRIQKRLISLNNMAMVIDLLEDKDVEVRRLASTSAQFIVSILIRDPNFEIHSRNSQQPNQYDPKAIKNKLIKSLQDQDDMVRLNTMTTLSFNRHLIFDKDFKVAILERINDNFKSVVILALELLKMFNDVDTDAIAKKLFEHEQTDVCIALIKYLEEKSYRNTEIYSKLSERNNVEIKSKAILTAMSLDIKDIEPKYQAFLTDATNPAQTKSEMIRVLPKHSQKNLILKTLLEDKTNSLRLDAIRIAPLILDSKELKKVLYGFSQDSSSLVQQESVVILLNYLTNEDIEIFKSLFKSNNKNIRAMVFNKFSDLKINNEEILTEALMDDEKSIRIKAIMSCGTQKINSPQIKTMLVRTLDDSDSDIQIEALRALTNFADDKEIVQLCKKSSEATEAKVRKEVAILLRKNNSSEAKEILTKLTNDADPIVNKEASLSLYLSGDKTSVDNLIKILLSQNIEINERIKIFQTVSQNKEIAQKPCAILLTDPVDIMRENAIKFFNANKDLYREEYFNFVFEEKNQMIAQITCELYINKKFQNTETIKKLIASLDNRLKITGYRVMMQNYCEAFLPIVKESLASNDSRTNYYATEISRVNAIADMTQPIIDKLTQKHDSQIRINMLWALLKINNEPANKYLQTIDEKHEFFNDLQIARKKNKLEESRPANPNDPKKR